jgi:Undecaprenyl-phosphate galactose phosphotransferase WbaP
MIVPLDPKATQPRPGGPTLPTLRAGSRLMTSVALMTSDLAALALAVALSVVLRKWFGGAFELALYGTLWPMLGVFLSLYAIHGLYADLPPPPSGELKRLSQATTFGFVALAASTFLSREALTYSRAAFVMAWGAALLSVPLARAALRALCMRRLWWGSPVIVIGAGRTGELVIRRLLGNPGMGLKPMVAFDDDPAKAGTTICGIPVHGRIADAPEMARSLGIRHAVVAMPGAEPQRLMDLWSELGPRFPHLIVIPGLMGFASLWVEAKDIGGVLGLEVRQSLLMTGPRIAKRMLDLAMVALLAVFVLPLSLLLVLAIVVETPAKPFYGQRRLGRGGASFTAWKFRSMRPGADAILAGYLAGHPELRAEWERDHKLRNDPRVTRIGRFLRKTSLDELPQLWNVLRGDMSLVGPRPVVEEEIIKYGTDFGLYQRVRPGLTGLWQVSGRNNLSYDERVALDAYYVRNWSVWLDAFILAKTVRVVLRGEGAY